MNDIAVLLYNKLLRQKTITEVLYNTVDINYIHFLFLIFIYKYGLNIHVKYNNNNSDNNNQ